MAFLHRKPVRCLALMLFLGLVFLPVTIPLRVLVLAGAALIWTLLEAGNLKPVGLGRHRLSSTLIWGVGLAAAVTILDEVVRPPIEQLLDMKPDYSAYGALAGNANAALRLLGVAMTSAAVGEEILFRGLLLHQLTAILGAGRARRWAVIVAGGVIFGLGHLVQGPLGAFTAGVVGVILGWAWFRSGRNLWATILAHALVDTYGIGMLYFGRYA